MTRARDPGRAECHVGLLQECLIQRGLRGFGNPRVTETCGSSAEACSGRLAGDLTAQAMRAQHETDQVTIQALSEEVELAAQLEPDSGYVDMWRRTLSQWEGGLPRDISDGGTTGHASP